MAGRVYVGVASYDRPRVLSLCLRSLRFCGVDAVLVEADASTRSVAEEYEDVLVEASASMSVEWHVHLGRRGSPAARNAVLRRARSVMLDDDTLVLYDDDYVCPGPRAVHAAALRLSSSDTGVGVVGGRVVNLKRRRRDPDFSLNVLPGLADALTRLTGFVFLDTRHGPRIVERTTPLMALRRSVLDAGVAYDPSYAGTGYREESDFQRQVRERGFSIVYEPSFTALHLCVEDGGNRGFDVGERFYWKARNHLLYSMRMGSGFAKRVAGLAVIALYAALHGATALSAVARGVRDAAGVRGGEVGSGGA